MPWTGNLFRKWNYSSNGWTGDAASNIGIEAGRHDSQDDDFANGINACLKKDASNAAFANDLDFGGYKALNIAASTARTTAPQTAQVQDGDFIWLGTTGGTATAMTATATPVITAYKNGQKFRMKPGFSSTGTVNTTHTLAINGLSAITILDGGQSPTLGSWETGTGRVLELVYLDGFFLITSSVKNLTTWTPTLTPQNGTATGTTFTIAKYQRINGNSCNITLRVTWTQNTAAANYIDITLPIRPSLTSQGFSCAITTGANLVTGFAIVSSTVGSGTVRCYDYAQGAIATGAKELNLTGIYEIG